MFFLKQFWSFVLFSFCIWFYVFAPGSHCFAIGKSNRSAICTVHFRSIWTAPLRFSTCRSWAGSKVTAAKLYPKKSNLKKKIRVPPSQLDFQTFFVHICLYVFTFCPSAFSKRIFSQMWKMWKKNAFWKCAWKKMWKNAFWKCGKNVKKCKHGNKRQLKSSNLDRENR